MRTEWEERAPEGRQEILDDRGEVEVVAVGDYSKVMEGTTIMLPREEAIRLMKAKVAEPFSELLDG